MESLYHPQKHSYLRPLRTQQPNIITTKTNPAKLPDMTSFENVYGVEKSGSTKQSSFVLLIAIIQEGKENSPFLKLVQCPE